MRPGVVASRSGGASGGEALSSQTPYTLRNVEAVARRTRTEGWRVTFDHDVADRLTAVTYPDGMTDVFRYNSGIRRVTAQIDPNFKQVVLSYNGIDGLTSLTDANNNVTTRGIHVEFPSDGQRLCREGFVRLDHVEIRDRQACPFEQCPHGWDRPMPISPGSTPAWA